MLEIDPIMPYISSPFPKTYNIELPTGSENFGRRMAPTYGETIVVGDSDKIVRVEDWRNFGLIAISGKTEYYMSSRQVHDKNDNIFILFFLDTKKKMDLFYNEYTPWPVARE